MKRLAKDHNDVKAKLKSLSLFQIVLIIGAISDISSFFFTCFITTQRNALIKKPAKLTQTKKMPKERHLVSAREIPTRMKIAENWTNLIEVMRHQVAESKMTRNQTTENSNLSNTVDISQDNKKEIGLGQISFEERLTKLNNLKEKQLISEEEYKQKKAEILAEI
ncbi:SHOCT domain-containing protein [Thermodesulfobacteriota bacterium]